MGDPVALLGLIDTPLPLGVPPLPASVLDSILSKIGKGSSASSSDIKLHFGFCAKNVSGFKAQSMGDAVPERVVVVNASDTKMLPGIMSNDRAAWQSLLTTKAELVISTIEADHFSIVAQPAVRISRSVFPLYGASAVLILGPPSLLPLWL